MKLSRKLFYKTVSYLVLLIIPTLALARGGGGGSGGGGGGSSGGGAAIIWLLTLFYYEVFHLLGNKQCININTCEPANVAAIITFFGGFFFIVAFAAVKTWRKRQKRLKKVSKALEKSKALDPFWDTQTLLPKVQKLFNEFQLAWQNFDTSAMSELVSLELYKKYELEMNVLYMQKRRNIMENIAIKSLIVYGFDDQVDNGEDRVTVEITASARDILLDTETNKKLFVDNSKFTEYWTLARRGDEIYLADIKQATEEEESVSQTLKRFANEEGFSFDPDFGWLMLPNKGLLFNRSRFGSTDINNHIIGRRDNKIVELYTIDFYNRFVAKSESAVTNYIVAQAILPVSYNHIIVRRKSFWNTLRVFFFNSKLKKHTFESNEFNRLFDIYADPRDNIPAFKLIEPQFMETLMKFKQEYSFEVVGNFLYFYAPFSSQAVTASYRELLAILDAAFARTERS